MESRLFFLAVLMALYVFTAGRVSADFPTPESSRLPYTVDQAAALMVARSDLIVEATVLDLKPIQVVQGMGCRWMSEIWLQPTRQLWGLVDEQKFRIVTEGVPPEQEKDLPSGCSVSHTSREESPPVSGDRGTFLLSTGSWQIVEGARCLTVTSVSCGYLPQRADSNTSVCIHGLRYTWPYEEVVSAITRRASSLSIESLMGSADAVFVGKGELSVARWTVDVENVYRGRVDDPFSILLPLQPPFGNGPQFVMQDMLVRQLAWWLEQRTGERFLVFANKQGDSWMPVPHGVWVIAAGGKVRLQTLLHDGTLGWKEVALADIEPLLRGRLQTAPLPTPANRKE
jgi:hypothetical protein